MAQITGRLLLDSHPNGTVRIVFIASVGGGNKGPLTAKSLDTAEIDFLSTFWLTIERAAKLRAGLERNIVVNVETSIDEGVAGKLGRPARSS